MDKFPVDRLPIPRSLSSKWTAPEGFFLPPLEPVLISGSVVVDLSKAQIRGNGDGYLFRPAGHNAMLTLVNGHIQDMAGVIIGTLGPGERAYASISGTITLNVRSLLFYKTADGGRMDAILSDVYAGLLGIGVRTWGSIDVQSSSLLGGGAYSSPAGLHAMDLNDKGEVVQNQTVEVDDSSIYGFTSQGFQGDGIVAEETVSRLVVTRSQFYGMTDAAVDSKAAFAFVNRCTFGEDGGFGHRIVACHTGHLESQDNTYHVYANMAALQATGDIDSIEDTFYLANTTSLVAKAEVACSGSKGFTGPRVGHIKLDSPVLSAAQKGSPLYKASSATCDGTVYTPTIEVLL